MAEKFDKVKHQKGDILKDAIRALGVEAPNEALRTWVNERFQGFPWAANSSTELANAKKAVAKESTDEPIKPQPVKAPKAGPRTPVAAAPATSESVPGVTPNAVIKALKRIAAMPADERAALDKALKAIEQFGSAEAAQVAIKKVTDLMS